MGFGLVVIVRVWVLGFVGFVLGLVVWLFLDCCGFGCCFGWVVAGCGGVVVWF